MKKVIFIAVLMLSFVTAYSTEGGFTLERAVVTDKVEEREPGIAVDAFSLYSKGYYFTEFKDIGDEVTVYHNWYYLGEGDEKTLTASIPLEIAGFRWRTWSTKNLYLPGQWTVEAVDGDDNLISSSSFTVE